MQKSIFSIVSLVFIFQGCFKSEPAPQDWLGWVEKAQARYQEPISVPSAIQHLYIPIAARDFYLTKTDDGEGFKLDKLSMFDMDTKYSVDFENEQLLSASGEVLGTTKDPIKVDDRISLSLSFYKDENRARVFLYDQKTKDLNKKRKRKFFSYSSRFVKLAKYKKLEKAETKKFGRSDGTTRDFQKVGELVIDSKNVLSLYAEPGDTSKQAMLMFRDQTNGSSTYGAGRYVVIDLPKEAAQLEEGSEIKVDFNYTFNPPCAVSKGFHCPLAQDNLSLKVKAGEKYHL